MPAQITQKNVRLLIPGKAAGVAVLMSEKRSISPKAALLAFYRSKTYRELERESSKYWHYSPEQLYIVGDRKGERQSYPPREEEDEED